MAHTATLEQLSASSISATVLKLTPMLLAVVLVVGCSTKAQRIGSLSGDPSMAASANSKGRGGVPDAAQPSPTNSQTASQGGKESAEGGTGSTSTSNDASGGDNLASKQADASPSSDEASTSSSSNGVGGVGSSARDGAGGDQASTIAGGGAAASARPGPARRAGATTAAAAGRARLAAPPVAVRLPLSAGMAPVPVANAPERLVHPVPMPGPRTSPAAVQSLGWKAALSARREARQAPRRRDGQRETHRARVRTVPVRAVLRLLA